MEQFIYFLNLNNIEHILLDKYVAHRKHFLWLHRDPKSSWEIKRKYLPISLQLFNTNLVKKKCQIWNSVQLNRFLRSYIIHHYFGKKGFFIFCSCLKFPHWATFFCFSCDKICITLHNNEWTIPLLNKYIVTLSFFFFFE